MATASMTALVSAFARAYHARNNDVKIFDDSVAGALLTEAEYGQIGAHMAEGIGFFNPAFVGGGDEALRWIVDNYLSPSPLGRAAFAEAALKNAVGSGVTQYIVFAAGYDTFAYRAPTWAEGLTVFELDLPATAADKRARLSQAGIPIPDNVRFVCADLTDERWPDVLLGCKGFASDKRAFCSLLGLSYYLPKARFSDLIASIGRITPQGSQIVLDYPDGDSNTARAGERAQKQAMLAGAANEASGAGYTMEETEALLHGCGFCVERHLTPPEITDAYFAAYNRHNPLHPMRAFDNVNYCLAVKHADAVAP